MSVSKKVSDAVKAAKNAVKKAKAKPAAKAKPVAKAKKKVLPKKGPKLLIINAKVTPAIKADLKARAKRFTEGNVTALLLKGALSYKGQPKPGAKVAPAKAA